MFSGAICQHVGNFSSFPGIYLCQFIQDQETIVVSLSYCLKAISRCPPSMDKFSSTPSTSCNFKNSCFTRTAVAGKTHHQIHLPTNQGEERQTPQRQPSAIGNCQYRVLIYFHANPPLSLLASSEEVLQASATKPSHHYVLSSHLVIHRHFHYAIHTYQYRLPCHRQAMFEHSLTIVGEL